MRQSLAGPGLTQSLRAGCCLSGATEWRKHGITRGDELPPWTVENAPAALPRKHIVVVGIVDFFPRPSGAPEGRKHEQPRVTAGICSGAPKGRKHE